MRPGQVQALGDQSQVNAPPPVDIHNLATPGPEASGMEVTGGNAEQRPTYLLGIELGVAIGEQSIFVLQQEDRVGHRALVTHESGTGWAGRVTQ